MLPFNRINLLFFSLLISFLLFGLIIYQLNKDFISVTEKNKWIRHTIEVINQTEVLLRVLKNAESTKRGFVITKDSTFLANYTTEINGIDAKINKLTTLVSDNPEQRDNLESLSILVKHKIENLRKNLALLTQSKIKDSTILANLQDGRKIMEKIDLLTQKINDKEAELLYTRENDLDQAIGNFHFTQILLTIGSMLIGAVFIYLSLQESARIRKLNLELISKNDNINSLNEELSAYNEELTSINEELNHKNENINVLNMELTQANQGLTQQNEEIASLNEELSASNELIKSQSEQLLILSEDKYKALVNSIQDVFFAFDREFRYTYLNAPGEKFIGKTMEEVIGKHYLEVVPHIKDSVYELFFQETLNSGKPQVLYPEAERDGQIIYFEMTAYPSDFGISIFAKDITINKEAQQKLKESEERYKYLFEHNPNPMMVYNKDSLEIVDVNKIALMKYGYSREEFLNLHLNQVRVNAEGSKNTKKVRKHELGYSETLGWVHRRKDGSLMDVEIHGFAFFDKHQLYRLISVIDITERVKAEEKVNKLIEELANKNHNLQEFTYIISHQLRTPIANIKGLTGIFNKEKPEDPVNMDVIEGLEHSSERLDTIVGDLNEVLNINRIENKVKKHVKLSAIIEDIEQNMELQLKESRTVIFKDFPENTSLFTIPSYLGNILYNLISNGIKFKSTEIDPVLHIRAREEEGEGYLCISVEDNGMGIDLSKFGKKIFGMYNRYHLSHEGKGLGLYIVKSQVEMLGGKVEVESELGKGSIFKIFLKMN